MLNALLQTYPIISQFWFLRTPVIIWLSFNHNLIHNPTVNPTQLFILANEQPLSLLYRLKVYASYQRNKNTLRFSVFDSCTNFFFCVFRLTHLEVMNSFHPKITYIFSNHGRCPHGYPEWGIQLSWPVEEEVYREIMVTMEPIVVGEHVLVGVEVKLPKTTLLTINTFKGYIMCGATTVSHFGTESQSAGTRHGPIWDKLSLVFESVWKDLGNAIKNQLWLDFVTLFVTFDRWGRLLTGVDL